MINLSRSLFIVDGPTEIYSFKGKFQKEFQFSPEFRKAGSNGISVSPEGYVDSILGTLILAFNSSFENVICILDREKRKLNYFKLALKIKNKIIEKLSSRTHFSEEEINSKVYVFVSDICFENWIVADIEGIKTKDYLISQTAIQKNYDGKNGVTILKRLMLVPYKKTLHAPKLFKAVSFERAKNNSNSFQIFIDTLGLA